MGYGNMESGRSSTTNANRFDYGSDTRRTSDAKVTSSHNNSYDRHETRTSDNRYDDRRDTRRDAPPPQREQTRYDDRRPVGGSSQYSDSHRYDNHSSRDSGVRREEPVRQDSRDYTNNVDRREPARDNRAYNDRNSRNAHTNAPWNQGSSSQSAGGSN